MNNRVNPPIIIIGMHRSGTTMIAKVLERLGLFVGNKKEPNHEAIFFHNINDWLLRQSGGAWDNPAPIRHLLANKEVRILAINYIRSLMNSPRVAGFLGWSKYLRYQTPLKLDIPWGWKDPRTTYTLPIWLDIFPDAKVVHIYRNGIDVAKSLTAREEKLLVQIKKLQKIMKFFYWLKPKRGGFTYSLRCATLENSFSLWEEYLDEANSHVSKLHSNAMELKYEDFLTNSERSLKPLAAFCGLSVTDEDISKATHMLKKERAYAYLSNPELKSFTEQVSNRLKIKGY